MTVRMAAGGVTGGAAAGRQVPGAARVPRLLGTVALVGMMGSGKTAAGQALAQHLRVPFLDSDHAIEEAAQATIAEIFARDGEPFFRDREAEVVARLLKGPPAVLSTGGGAFLAERNRQAIAASGVAVWLDSDLDTLWERVRHKEGRPLLRTADPRATLADLFEARVPVYRLAGLRVPSGRGCSVEDTVSGVVEALALLRPDILENA